MAVLKKLFLLWFLPIITPVVLGEIKNTASETAATPLVTKHISFTEEISGKNGESVFKKNVTSITKTEIVPSKLANAGRKPAKDKDTTEQKLRIIKKPLDDKHKVVTFDLDSSKVLTTPDGEDKYVLIPVPINGTGNSARKEGQVTKIEKKLSLKRTREETLDRMLRLLKFLKIDKDSAKGREMLQKAEESLLNENRINESNNEHDASHHKVYTKTVTSRKEITEVETSQEEKEESDLKARATKVPKKETKKELVEDYFVLDGFDDDHKNVINDTVPTSRKTDSEIKGKDDHKHQLVTKTTVSEITEIHERGAATKKKPKDVSKNESKLDGDGVVEEDFVKKYIEPLGKKLHTNSLAENGLKEKDEDKEKFYTKDEAVEDLTETDHDKAKFYTKDEAVEGLTEKDQNKEKFYTKDEAVEGLTEKDHDDKAKFYTKKEAVEGLTEKDQDNEKFYTKDEAVEGLTEKDHDDKAKFYTKDEAVEGLKEKDQDNEKFYTKDEAVEGLTEKDHDKAKFYTKDEAVEGLKEKDQDNEKFYTKNEAVEGLTEKDHDDKAKFYTKDEGVEGLKEKEQDKEKFYTKHETVERLKEHQDKEKFYTKDEAVESLKEKDQDNEKFYTKHEAVEGLKEDHENDKFYTKDKPVEELKNENQKQETFYTNDEAVEGLNEGNQEQETFYTNNGAVEGLNEGNQEQETFYTNDKAAEGLNDENQEQETFYTNDEAVKGLNEENQDQEKFYTKDEAVEGLNEGNLEQETFYTNDKAAEGLNDENQEQETFYTNDEAVEGLQGENQVQETFYTNDGAVEGLNEENQEQETFYTNDEAGDELKEEDQETENFYTKDEVVEYPDAEKFYSKTAQTSVPELEANKVGETLYEKTESNKNIENPEVDQFYATNNAQSYGDSQIIVELLHEDDDPAINKFYTKNMPLSDETYDTDMLNGDNLEYEEFYTKNDKEKESDEEEFHNKFYEKSREYETGTESVDPANHQLYHKPESLGILEVEDTDQKLYEKLQEYETLTEAVDLLNEKLYSKPASPEISDVKYDEPLDQEESDIDKILYTRDMMEEHEIEEQENLSTENEVSEGSLEYSHHHDVAVDDISFEQVERFKNTNINDRAGAQWFDNNKIGVILYWGVYSVPSFGSEYFWKNLRDNKPEYVDFMESNYRNGYTYQDFAESFTAEFYDPDLWLDLFESAGVRMVLMTAKNYDGYSLWPTKYSFGWNVLDVGPNRDLLGELRDATRRMGLNFGVHYTLQEWHHPLNIIDKMHGFKTTDYIDRKVLPQLTELVKEYEPDILWMDGDCDATSSYYDAEYFLKWLYGKSNVKHHVVTNDHWGKDTHLAPWAFNTYEQDSREKLLETKWATTFSVDKHSNGYRRGADIADYMTSENIIHSMIKTVAAGGNFFLNIGITKEGTIAPIFQERLADMGDWLKIYGDAIYESTPWDPIQDPHAEDVYYTTKNNSLYALVLKWPKHDVLKLGALAQERTRREVTEIHMFGTIFSTLQFGYLGDGLIIRFPPRDTMNNCHAWVMKLTQQ